jgi:hypothetical protein
MIVNRRTFAMKRGCMEEVVALVKADWERNSWPHARRLYTPNIAPFGVMVVELEFENLAEYEKSWAEWFASPEGVAFMEKWVTLTRSSGTNEIWNLVE